MPRCAARRGRPRARRRRTRRPPPPSWSRPKLTRITSRPARLAPAHRGEDVAGPQAAARARAARRYREAGEVETDQLCGGGDTGQAVAADRRVARRGGGDHLAARADDRVVEPCSQCRPAIDRLGLGERRRPAERTGQVLGTGAIAALLPAGGRERRQITDQQRADTRRPAVLVCGKRDEVGVGGHVRVGAGRASARHRPAAGRRHRGRLGRSQRSAGAPRSRCSPTGRHRECGRPIRSPRIRVRSRTSPHTLRRALNAIYSHFAGGRSHGRQDGSGEDAVSHPTAEHIGLRPPRAAPRRARPRSPLAARHWRGRLRSPATRSRRWSAAARPTSRAPRRSAHAPPPAPPAPPGPRRAATTGWPSAPSPRPPRRARRASSASSRRDRDRCGWSKAFQSRASHLYSAPSMAVHPARSQTARTPMPEVIFPGPDGRLEGRFAPAPKPRAPVAMILHPHPSSGGTMNNRIVQELYKTFQRRGFATLRFNFRGVGKSQGVFDNGVGELSDAASALDWVQSFHHEAQTTWVGGVRLRRMDRHAVADAPAGGARLHLDRTARQHVRLHLPGALPGKRHHHPGRGGRGGDAGRRRRSWSTSCARRSTSPSTTTRSRRPTTSSSTRCRS